jgi:Ca-activated chloride channel homolog
MDFLAPAAFWFAASMPVVILFYLLKRKRVVKLVSSTLLWQRFLAETQANAPFQRLRHNWLLILQLLLLALVIFALSRPFFAGGEKPSRLKIVILDASASMKSTDVAPSRFEAARLEALKWVDTLRDQDQMLVIQAAANTEVKQSPTSEKTALRRAIQSSVPTDSSARLDEALTLAETLIRDRVDAEIHLFSDGAFGRLDEFESKNLPLVFHRVGQRGNNVAIIALDVRANPDNPQERAIYTSVMNYSTNVHAVELTLEFGNESIEVRALTLPPGESSPQVFLAEQPRDGVFTVRLKADDDLAADNRASIVSLLPQPARVLLVTRGNRFLERAVRAVPNVELAVANDVASPADSFDIVLLDNVSPSVWPSGNVLAFHVANTNWFDSWRMVEAPPILDWRATHPLLRYVNFDNVHVAGALAVSTPSWANAVVESQQAPLLLAGEHGRQRIVWVAFDTLQSTWPLRISFPIFIANAIEWLNPHSAHSSQFTLRTGEPFRLTLAEPIESASVTFPNGSRRNLAVDPGSHHLIFGDTMQQGVYRLRAGSNDVVFCANLLDGEESNTQPAEKLEFGKYTEVGAAAIRRANVEIWRWIALAGLAVLLFEWWYYHRRTA